MYSRRPPVCHVPGCGAALSDSPNAPRYCFRFRICLMHLRAETVQLPAGPHRHCQQCCAFHPLAAFSGAKRTCARRLAEQAARRRRGGGGALVSSSESVGRGLSASDESADVETAQRFAFAEALLGGAGVPPAPAAAPAAAAPAAWSCGAAELPVPREASLKLGGATPGQLPAALAPALASAWCADMALSMEAAPRPGCTLLHLDALLPVHAPPAPDAATLARVLCAGPLGSWLAGRRLDVRCGGGAQPASSADESRLPRLRPAALLCSALGELRTTSPVQPLPHDVALCGRLHGQNITQLRCVAAPDGSLRLTLPAIGAEGAARLWLAAEGAVGGAARAVLLTSDAGIAAEVSAALSDADEEEQERLICTLGAALRPGCLATVVAAAAHASLRRGWEATSARLLPSLSTALVGGDAEDRAAARTLLHAAALSGNVQLVQLTLQHGGSNHVFGAPETADERGFTPMHLAAAAGDAAVAMALATSTPSAHLAWFYAKRLQDGAAPVDVARATGGVAAETLAVLRRRLDAARELAAALAEGAPSAGEDPQTLELARLLLRSYAPVDGAACAPEQALFDAHRMASRRYLALLTPPFFVAISLRSLFLPPPDAATLAAVASPARPSFALLLDVYKAVQRPFALMTLLANAALLALAGLPALRAAYHRHGRAALRVYTLLQFLLRRALVELYFTHAVLGGAAAVWPSPAGAALVSLSTVHMAAMPLPAPDVLALLALQWALVGFAHATGAPLWPQSAAPSRDALLRTALHAALAAAVLATDARALAAWRASRRASLALRSHKQA